MNNILATIKTQDNFISTGAVKNNLIVDAEKKLKLTFSDEYIKYVLHLGCASFVGHELTGICPSERLGVVETTIRCRDFNPNVPEDWYVIEEANIDGIVLWQDSTGAIYQTQPNKEPITIASSLADYITQL